MTKTRLEDILKLVVKWEEQLNDFYTIVSGRLKNQKSRKVIELLKSEQGRILENLRGMDLAKYKNTEFIMNPPDWHKEEVISHVEITENSSPEEIFDRILDYERKLKEYYAHMRNLLANKNDRELLNILVHFKANQIKHILDHKDDYELAAEPEERNRHGFSN